MIPKFKVTEDKGRYRPRFKLDGRSITHYFGTDDHSTAERLAKRMRLQWELNEFDRSLTSYKARISDDTTQQEPATDDKPWPPYTYLKDAYKAWLDSLNLPAQTRNNHYHWLGRMVEKANPELDQIAWFVNDTKLSAKTWNERKSYLASCYDWLIEQDAWRETNHYKALKARKASKTDRVKPFSKDEIKLILEALSSDTYVKPSSNYPHSHYVPFVRFLFITGTRLGEAIALTWDCIDEENSLIAIKQALGRALSSSPNTRRKVLKETKTGAIHYLPLNDELRKIFNCQNKDSKYIFPNHAGNSHIDTDSFRKTVWKPVLAKLGIPYRYPYQSRHTVLSEVAKTQGLLAASKLAGHTDAKMVSKHYAKYIETVELPSTE